jgi:hypothetical protein
VASQRPVIVSVVSDGQSATRKAQPTSNGTTFTSVDLIALLREEGPLTAAEMAAHFGCNPHLIHNRLAYIRKGGNERIRPAGNNRWEYVARPTHGRPAKPAGTLYMRLVDEVRKHPDGVTSLVVAGAVGMDAGAVSANLAFAEKRGYVRKIVAAHPDGNSSRKLATWYPVENVSAAESAPTETRA